MDDRISSVLLLAGRARTAPKGSLEGPPCCGACGAGLDLYQPDLERPEAMLGTCPDCGAWHFVACPEEGGRFAILLPLAELLGGGRRPAATGRVSSTLVG